MGMDKAPKPPIAGIIYGEFAFWLVIIGLIVAVVGSIIYFATEGYVNKEALLESLWEGADSKTIWEEHSTDRQEPHGHWYLSKLTNGDAIAMAGIAIACFAAVIGMWGVLVGMLRSRDKIYIVFALIIAVILTLSALGILSLEH